MASVVYSRINGQKTDQHFFTAHKRNSCGFSLFGNIIDYSFRRGSAREGHEVSNMTLTPNQSLNATANQLK